MDLTDRDRLSFAFDDLKLLGIRAEVEMGSQACCYLRALELLQKGGLHGVKGLVFWTIPRDIHAFSSQLPVEAYSCDHGRTQPDARPELGDQIQRSLPLYWLGPGLLIVETLREWGLMADFPNSDGSSIEVRSLVAIPGQREALRTAPQRSAQLARPNHLVGLDRT